MEKTSEKNTLIQNNLPEITLKALVLGVILAVILAAANAYLGLKAGTTISASIPAAIISMGILRLFKTSNVLENNIVQTAASAGEALVAGMAYIIPALLVLGYWHDFNYLSCVLLAIAGGGLGVVYSVPIRRVMLSNPHLPFPEGVAIGQVLKASADKSMGIGILIAGGAVGGVIGLMQDGLKLLSGALIKWTSIGSTVFGYGIGFSPALIAAGYIIGIEVGVGLFVGTLVGWAGTIPVLSHLSSVSGLAPADFVHKIAGTQLRYIGLGVMMVGGVTTLLSLIRPISAGVRSIVKEKKLLAEEGVHISRLEQNLSMKHILIGFFSCVLIIFFVLRHYVVSSFGLPTVEGLLVVLGLLVFVLVACFVFSCLCAYFSGLVGATNNPGSAMVLASVILSSFLMIMMVGAHLGSPAINIAAASLVIIASTIVSNSAVVGCETIQDLKAGQIVEATPWKQQFMMFVGVVVSALVIPAVLKLLFNAYGMAGIYPRAGMDPEQMLAAPQSTMMAVVVKAVFAHDLPWGLLTAGFCIAFAGMFLNLFLRKRKLHLVIMAVGLGIYIPLDATMPIVLGTIVSYLVKRYAQRTNMDVSKRNYRQQRGLMLACGMVAGCALMGVILAIPFALLQSTDALAVVSDKFVPVASTLSVVVTLGILYWFYHMGTTSKISDALSS